MPATTLTRQIDQRRSISRPAVATGLTKPGLPLSDPGAQAPDTLWQLIGPYVWPHRRLLFGAFLLNLLPGLAIAFQTLVPRYLVDDIIRPAISVEERVRRLAILMGLFLFGAIFLRMGAWYASYRIFTAVREKVILKLRTDLFRRINHLCLRFHGRHSSGELFSYVMGTPLNDISTFYHRAIVDLPNCATTFIISSVWVFFWDWTLSLVLLFLVFSTVFSMQTSGKRLQKLIFAFQKAEGQIIGRVSDIFRGNRDVKIHAIEDRMTAKFAGNADQLRQRAYERDIETHKVNMRPEGLSYLCFVILCCVGTWRYLGHHLTEGQLVAFLASYGALQLPLNLVFTIGTMRGQARAGLTRLREVLVATSSTPEPEADQARTLPPGQTITIDNLTFSYQPGQPVLHQINLQVPFGERVAFVGPSGSGKSTLAKMLLRLYDPDYGSIRFNDVDLRDVSTVDIRRRFGVVPQDPYFFAATIRENLQIMADDVSEEKLRQVCELANAWEFISRMPDGLDTTVGEGGARLSGGQRQRLAIARALMTDPSTLLFDEATSALDTVSEKLFKDALGQILRGRTAFFIAHRLSTIMNCDRIIVIERGRIVQDGTYQELSRVPGLFRQMVESDKFETAEEKMQSAVTQVF